MPTDFLTRASDEISAAGYPEDQGTWRTNQVSIGAEPRALVLDSRYPTPSGDLVGSPSGRAYVALANGQLAVVALDTLDVEKRIDIGSDPQALAPGAKAGTVYATLGTGEVIWIDTLGGEITARTGGLGRPRGLVFDPLNGHLLVADAKAGAIVRFNEDLSVRLDTHRLDDLPEQVLLDPVARRLYVTLPGVRRVLALDADSLRQVAAVDLVGGPLIEATLDAARGRMYLLSALSSEYRGLSVLKAEDLASLALVAGSPGFPLKQATAMALAPDGGLLVAEGADMYCVSPEDFSVANLARLEYPVWRRGLAADPATGRMAWIDTSGVLVFLESE